ncbi:hypothetical protein [Allokutzneria sp. NRRL B-24872]|uniref:hypothetical protein n=1 Tax=Allokutzneria sp. NRRL B-24872 TaxID=1137961 RepID=UPI000A37FCD1|nr:hypothetical protein [Allokutzneria sp. NRRL B-24872]
MSSSAPARVGRPVILLLVLAALPVAAMLFEVLRSPRLHFLDYWSVFTRVTNDDGSLYPRGVLTYQNEHPMFLPGLLFWLEAKLLGGYNQVLGLIDVIMVSSTVLLLHRLLPRELGDTKRAALTAGFSFLLFTTSGLHNFSFGFSGIGWLSANLAAVGALVLAWRGRRFGAIAVGLLGCACYGTAFAVWPALALVNWLRRERARWVVGPLAIGVVVVLGWAMTYGPKPSLDKGDLLGLDSYLSAVAAALGQLWSTNQDVATGAGVLTGLLVAGFAGLAVRRRLADDVQHPQTPWIGVAVYAAGAAVMISAARAGAGLDIASTSRYASIPALAACAALALVVISWPKVSAIRVAGAAVAVGLVTYAIGSVQAGHVRAQYAKQDLLAIAMRTDATTMVTQLRAKVAALPAARALGLYPFNEDFSLGCGGHELGQVIGADALTPVRGVSATERTGGNLDSPAVGDSLINGWAMVADKRVDCVLVLDGAGTVVGGGVTGVPRPDVAQTLGAADPRLGFTAIAGPGTAGDRVVVSAGGRLYQLASG